MREKGNWNNCSTKLEKHFSWSRNNTISQGATSDQLNLINWPGIFQTSSALKAAETFRSCINPGGFLQCYMEQGQQQGQQTQSIYFWMCKNRRNPTFAAGPHKSRQRTAWQNSSMDIFHIKGRVNKHGDNLATVLDRTCQIISKNILIFNKLTNKWSNKRSSQTLQLLQLSTACPHSVASGNGKRLASRSWFGKRGQRHPVPMDCPWHPWYEWKDLNNHGMVYYK